MARTTSPVSPPVLAADHTTVMALQSLVGYQPFDANLTVPNLLQLQATLAQARQATSQAEIALDQARSIEAQTSHLYHNAVVAARAHVFVQFGSDSAAVEQVGLTRKSNRKRPARRKATA
jgi:hypothetical protein